MDTEQLEKEFQIWNCFMYMGLASSITLVVISLGNFLSGGWSGFERYAGGLWPWMQLAVTPAGFYLLWGKHWRNFPLSNRKNTAWGFFIASWFTFLSLGFITVNGPLVNFSFLIIGGVTLLGVGYINFVKRKLDQSDEMFP